MKSLPTLLPITLVCALTVTAAVAGCDKSKPAGEGDAKADGAKKDGKGDKGDTAATPEPDDKTDDKPDEPVIAEAATAGDQPTEDPEAKPDPDAPTGPVFDEEGDGEGDGYVLHLEHEHVGELHVGMDPAEVEKILGAPKSKGEVFEEGATGLWVSDWNYPDKGVTLHMASNDKKGTRMSVNGLSADKTCSLSLPWGLKIGSTRAEVEKIYGDKFHDMVTDDSVFVAGSVYGGTFYNFEDGKVVSIFIGAGAE